MKNKLLSKGLFKEGMRQLRALGLAYFCISALSALYTCYSYIIEAITSERYYSDMEVSLMSGSISSICSWGIYVFLPIMCLTLFGYLNSRSASDFYHSMPNTRLCTVLSFTASIAVWFFSAVLVDFIMEIAVGAICGFEIMWEELFNQLLVVIVSFVQLYGIMLVSVSLATRTINQVVLSFMIAFLPRILILILSGISESGAPVLVGLSDSLGVFADVDINILFGGVILSSFVDYSGALIYSFVLGIIYCVLGTVFYIRRKSEAATLAGANKFVQCTIRVLVAFVVCLIPCFTFGSAFISAANIGELLISLISLMPLMLLIYGFAVIAYFLYEAISTRNFKGAFTLKGTMGIGLIALIVLNLIFTITPTVSAKIALAADISDKTVSAISINTEDTLFDSYDIGYEDIGIDEIEFKNKQIISILCETLDDNIDAIESGDDNVFYDREYLSVEFHMNDGRILKRNVYLTATKITMIRDIMMEDDAYRNLLRRVPKASEASTIYFSGVDLSSKQIKQLYECLYSEIAAMDDDESFSYLDPDKYIENTDDYDFYYEGMIDQFYVVGSKNGKYWNNCYPVNYLVPETMKLYISIANEENDYLADEISEIIEGAEATEVDVTYFNDKNIPGEIYDIDSTYGWLTDDIEEMWNEPVEGAFYKVDFFIYNDDLQKFDGFMVITRYIDADIFEKYAGRIYR